MQSATVDWTKLSVALAIIVGMVVLMATDTIDAATGVPTITLIAGYIFGNGRSTAQGNIPGAMITPTNPTPPATPEA